MSKRDLSVFSSKSFIVFRLAFMSWSILSLLLCLVREYSGLPDGSDGKESACSAGHAGSVPG